MPDIYSEGQKEKNEAAKKEATLLHLRDVNDFKLLAKRPEFQRFLLRKLKDSGCFLNPFNSDSNVSAYNCGILESGRKLISEMNEADPMLFAKIQRDFLSERNSKQEIK